MSNISPPAETPCTCAVLRRTARRVTRFYDQALRPVGLRLTQYSVLANIARSEGLSITELAERLEMDRSTLTRNLRPMVRSGWIRIESGADKRQRAVVITQAGKAKFEEALPLWKKTELTLRSAMGKEEVALLRDLLDRVLTHSQ
ncbi:MAG: MarR family winged helix-turn-helix transcriptional regulator [Gammaproteobacteria bacterium]